MVMVEDELRIAPNTASVKQSTFHQKLSQTENDLSYRIIFPFTHLFIRKYLYMLRFN